MEAGYFLNIADNTGDELSYEIIPVNTVNKIPKSQNPVKLICRLTSSALFDSSENMVSSPKIVGRNTWSDGSSKNKLLGRDRGWLISCS